MNNDPYRTLFVCSLRQETALSVGGTDDDGPWDMGLARDGEGRIVLAGRTLAGGLLATARTFLDVPNEVSRPFDDEGVAQTGEVAEPPSLWEVWNAHAWADGSFIKVTAEPATDPRTGAAHRQDTRATASGGLFELEVLPRGLRWRFCVDVRHPPAGRGQRAAAIAALALREWAWGRCWMGRRMARGLGWMTLEECKISVLPRTEECVDRWPTASCTDLDAVLTYIEHLEKNGATRFESLEGYLDQHKEHAGKTRPTRAYMHWPLRIGVEKYCPDPDDSNKSYGLDALSIGGHGTALLSAERIGRKHFLRASEQLWDKFKDAFLPDFSLAMDLSGGTASPLVPGSSIGGAIRHHLARLKRAGGEAVLDPVTRERYAVRNGSGAKIPQDAEAGADAVSALFGHIGKREEDKQAQPSKLLIRDAHAAGDNWQVALLEKVVLDEFRQSAFERNKFDRMAVLQGAWEFDVVQEIDWPAAGGSKAEARDASAWRSRMKEATALFRALLEAAKQRRIGFGGGEFRAYGHVPVTLREQEQVQWAPAGEAWADWTESETSAAATRELP